VSFVILLFCLTFVFSNLPSDSHIFAFISKTRSVSAMTGASFREEAPGETFDVIAPAGKLGVVVDIPPDRRGAPFVCDIRDTSPLYGQIQPGDKIYAVDDEDVRKMSAIKVSKLLAQKAEQPERIITLFREYADD
jgi:C-terminal processing protease CtpA/Prc